jgi:dihydrofolate reductase
MAGDDEEIFIMGGAQIYREALAVADRMYITHVERDYEGDTSFPEIDYSMWRECNREDFSRGEEFEYPFSFITLERV